MAGRCGCGSSACSCLLSAGAGITVTGVGSASNPYVISTASASITVLDTPSVDLTLTGLGVLSADVILDPAAGNQIVENAGGLFVPASASITVLDTASVDLTLTGLGVLSADVILDPAAGNQIVENAGGLFVPAAPAGGNTAIGLSPGAAIFPDGTASNLAPQLASVKSSAAAPTPYFYQLNFDAAQLEQVTWAFRMPTNYASAPVLRVQYKMTSAVVGAVVLNARIAATTPGDATDVDAKAFAAVNTVTDTVPATTAGFMKEVSITMTNADSVAAGDFVIVYLGRDGAAGGDTAAGDMEVVGVSLTYTS